MIERGKPVKQSILTWAAENRVVPGAYTGKPEKPFDYSRNRHPATDCLVYVRQGARCDGLYPMSEKEAFESICYLMRGCVECPALCTMRMYKRSFKKVYRGRRRIQRLKAEMMKPKHERLIIGKMCVMKSAGPWDSIVCDDNSGGE